MKIRFCTYIFLLLSLFAFSETEESDFYNLEIKDKISSDYSGSFDNKKSIQNNSKDEEHRKWFAEDFFKSVDKYFQYKEKQYKAYKKQLEKDISDDLNERIVPKYLDSKLDVIFRLDENTENIKLKYRYTPEIVKYSYVDLGLEEEEIKVSYIYEKPLDGLNGYFFDSVGYIFDRSIKNILEISKLKLK